jgi:hypothetical protein
VKAKIIKRIPYTTKQIKRGDQKFVELCPASIQPWKIAVDTTLIRFPQLISIPVEDSSPKGYEHLNTVSLDSKGIKYAYSTAAANDTGRTGIIAIPIKGEIMYSPTVDLAFKATKNKMVVTMPVE